MTQSKQVVFADAAPTPRRGLYNQAIIVNSMVYTSGFTPVDPRSGLLVRGSVADRARQCITNIAAVLAEAGTSLDHAVKVTVYLTRIEDFDQVNDVYADYWGDVKPARTCVAVKELPRQTDIEIECIAVIPSIYVSP